MMTKIYPLNPIVTNNAALTSRYNSELTSSYLLSECLASECIEDLLEQGAVFNKLIFVDGQGESLLAKLGDVNNWDNELMPRFEHYSYDGGAAQAVAEIQNLLKANAAKSGMG